MYRQWIAILCRESVIYLDSRSICANGEIFETRFILPRCRNAGPQENDGRAISVWPGRLSNAAKVSVGPRVFIFGCDRVAYRNSTCLPMPTLTLTRVSSSMVLMIGLSLEW